MNFLFVKDQCVSISDQEDRFWHFYQIIAWWNRGETCQNPHLFFIFLIKTFIIHVQFITVHSILQYYPELNVKLEIIFESLIPKQWWVDMIGAETGRVWQVVITCYTSTSNLTIHSNKIQVAHKRVAVNQMLSDWWWWWWCSLYCIEATQTAQVIWVFSVIIRKLASR